MADTRDLCTVDDVKGLMQKSGQNASAQDTLIQSLITRASVKIMRDYGREFVPGGATSELATNATRTFEFEIGDRNDESYVDLYPYDLQTSPTPTVIVDSDTTSPTTLDTDHYKLWPVPPSQGVYMAVRVRCSSSATLTNWRRRQITVQGNWGFSSVPYEAAGACAETVIHWITSYPGARRVDQVDAALMGSSPRSYPMAAIDLLRVFERAGY